MTKFEYLRLSYQGSSRSRYQAGMFDGEGVVSMAGCKGTATSVGEAVEVTCPEHNYIHWIRHQLRDLLRTNGSQHCLSNLRRDNTALAIFSSSFMNPIIFVPFINHPLWVSINSAMVALNAVANYTAGFSIIWQVKIFTLWQHWDLWNAGYSLFNKIKNTSTWSKCFGVCHMMLLSHTTNINKKIELISWQVDLASWSCRWPGGNWSRENWHRVISSDKALWVVMHAMNNHITHEALGELLATGSLWQLTCKAL